MMADVLDLAFQAVVTHLTWVLRIKLRSSGRAPMLLADELSLQPLTERFCLSALGGDPFETALLHSVPQLASNKWQFLAV